MNSQELIDRYHTIFEIDPEMEGIDFRVCPTHIDIFQEVDGEDEPDQYLVKREEVREEEWDWFGGRCVELLEKRGELVEDLN